MRRQSSSETVRNGQKRCDITANVLATLQVEGEGSPSQIARSDAAALLHGNN
jgi:hypothetical protein